MIKIKVIDLLNKIANGELEYNTKFKIISPDKEFICRYDKDVGVIMVIGDDYEFSYVIDYVRILNYKVEIIEEDKKIEKLKGTDNDYYINYATCNVVNKINEIIGHINKE